MERAIRSLTILRKNAGFAQSIEGLKILCGLQSIWETAKACGIKDVTGWLIEYTRELAAYYEGNAWTEEAEKGNVSENLNRQLRINWEQRWPELSKGFEFEKYYPWNYQPKSEL